jgi:HK97 family phage prohead protease
MSTMIDERRTMGFELRDVETTDSLSMLRGRAVPYGVEADIGWFLEEFAKGSLGKSARESAAALPLMLFHGADGHPMPIGAIARWDEQSTGLWGEWHIDDDATAQDAARKAKTTDDRPGSLNFMSIRFAPIRSEWTYVDDFNPELGASHKDRVVRKEARLLEVSLVPTPAYNDATIQWVRSAEKIHPRKQQRRAADAWRAELEKLKASR